MIIQIIGNIRIGCSCEQGHVLCPKRRKHAAARRGRTRGGGFAPSCESPPPRDVTGCPRPHPNFLHMLWKNLRCDNVASVAFCAGAGRRGRPAVTVCRLLCFTQRFFRMLLRCCTLPRQDAPAYLGVRGNTICAELPPLRPLVFLSQRSRYEVGAQSAPCSQEEEGRSIRGEKRDRFAPLMRPPRAAARFHALPKRASAVETARLAAQATFPSL